MNRTYLFSALVIISVITILLRIGPGFLLGPGKETPKVLNYLSNVLPYAIMGMLIVYCLKDVSGTFGSHGIPEAVAILLTGGLQAWRKNTILSIIAGTAVYMVLLQFVF